MSTIDLPYTLEMTLPFRAIVYPSTRDGQGDAIRGRGSWKIRLEPTEKEGIANLHFLGLWAQLDPGSVLHFDIDGDGFLETLDISGFRLSPDDLDLRKSGGEIDLRTGEVTMHLIMHLDLSFIPQFERRGKVLPLVFDITEHGRFDLVNGKFYSHSAPFVVLEGPLAGLTVLNCIDDDPPCYSTITLGISVLSGNPASYDIPIGKAPKEVWICPGTPIMLLWASTNKGTWSVDINPFPGSVSANGKQKIPDVTSNNPRLQKALSQSTSFVGTVVGGDCRSDKDDVTVNIISGGEQFSQTADFHDGRYWTAYLPDFTYDRNILVSRIMIALGQADSITHPSWRVDHLYANQPPVGTTLPALNTWTNVAKKHALPGEYRFTPMPYGTQLPAGEERKKLYFILEVTKCTAQ
ncbi:MAG: hypothetical protein ABFD58_08950 [Anaerolineaceae bacterium]